MGKYKLIIESTLLKEISLDEAFDILDKRLQKMFKNYIFLSQVKSGETKEEAKEAVKWFYTEEGRDARETVIKSIRRHILRSIPEDIEEGQEAMAILWITRVAQNDIINFIRDASRYHVADDLEYERGNMFERFFHWQQFMEPNDLNKIKSFEELENVTRAAVPVIKKYQEEQAYADASKGKEILRDDENWEIVAIHNKGAACELGKGTDWCTAAPGLDYFKQYYTPESPLFFFKNKKTGERRQFHYTSDQFMDENDYRVSDAEFYTLHKLLLQTGAAEKYEILKNNIKYENLRLTGEMGEAFADGDLKSLGKKAEELIDEVVQTGRRNGVYKIFRLYSNLSEDKVEQIIAPDGFDYDVIGDEPLPSSGELETLPAALLRGFILNKDNEESAKRSMNYGAPGGGGARAEHHFILGVFEIAKSIDSNAKGPATEKLVNLIEENFLKPVAEGSLDKMINQIAATAAINFMEFFEPDTFLEILENWAKEKEERSDGVSFSVQGPTTGLEHFHMLINKIIVYLRDYIPTSLRKKIIENKEVPRRMLDHLFLDEEIFNKEYLESVLEKDINGTTRRNIERALSSDRFARFQKSLPQRKRSYPKKEKKDEPKKELRETKRRITLRIKINKK